MLLIVAAGLAHKMLQDVAVTPAQARQLIASVLDRGLDDDAPIASSAPAWLAQPTEAQRSPANRRKPCARTRGGAGL
jgi:hypothetical protein